MNKVLRRNLEVTFFVGLYMALGWYFHLDPNLYLVLGIPLTVLFQIFIRRESLVIIWVKEASKFKLDKTGICIAVLLTIEPIWLLQKYYSSFPSGQSLWFLVCLLGALPAAFCIRQMTKEKLKELFYCLATAGVIGCLIMVASGYVNHVSITPSFSLANKFATNLLSLFNVCFLMEEVTFRGVLDSHLFHVGESHSWFSAIFISALWGLWHLPLTGSGGTNHPFATAVALILVHSLIGVPLSFYWRRSGNLAVTSFTHAFIDAVRNTLLH